MSKTRSPTVFSFFSGAGGLDEGFKQAGYKVVLANDVWEDAAKTFTLNHPNTIFVEDDISNLSEDFLLSVLEEQGVDQVDVMIGGPPCQCFTRLNNNNLRKDDKRNQLFREYVRVMRILQPRFVVMENVPDMLVRENKKGQDFQTLIKRTFNRSGYRVAFKVFETEYYGVPQKRRRVIFLATNQPDIDLTFPEEDEEASVVKDFLKQIDGRKNYPNNEVTENGRLAKERIKHVPPGGYYRDLPKRLKVKKIVNGKVTYPLRYGSHYRRLHKDEPALTITNNYLIHPTKDRYITNREKALLHTFPLDYVFEGTLGSVSQQIANAVPPEFARRIAIHLKPLIEQQLIEILVEMN